MEPDHYMTLAAPVEGVMLKERKSKFVGYAYPVENEAGIDQLLQNLKQEHGKANHICYAWQLGAEPISWRVNDDGEPNNSAGQPIYGQIQAFGLTNVLVAVVRYFGGTKLGVGGLISAYRQTAQLTLEAGKTQKMTLYKDILVEFDYSRIHQVMRLIKRYEIEIRSQDNGVRAKYLLGVPVSRYVSVLKKLKAIQGVSASGKS